ncbi:MAG: DUF1428 domain-containing protein [Clostridia bacterium]
MYVDGFLIPVPKKNTGAYKRVARRMAGIMRSHGALECRECMAEDVKPGKVTSFPQAVKLRKDEVVWFSYIVYKNRVHRDRVMAAAMKDKRMAALMDPKKFPFDGQRLIFGGFKVEVAR